MSETEATDPVAALKERHRSVWAAGDYPHIAELVTGVGANCIEAADISPGVELLDVATGPGNAAIRAALRGARVTGVDLTPELIENARERARTAEVEARAEFVVGDAEDLPFADGSFDRVISAIGVQFAPRHDVVARELARVLRPGGRLVLGNWTREGLIGRLFTLMGEFQPPLPAWASPPPLWGDEEHVRGLLEPLGIELSFEPKHVVMPFATVEDFMTTFETDYGPSLAFKAALETQGLYGGYRERWAVLLEEFVQTPGSGDVRQDYHIITGTKP